ncbi:MAG: TetR/AcrR family transcriptional regulator [Clostridiales bacterium]|nr:TetR/AcrR family transcriptional regulator [Clostridiales bacterium]
MNYNEEAIKKAVVQLLEEKPYNKITVKNIVERCQVNRNTFYYHFHSIPELLEDLIKEYADNIIQQHKNFDEPLDCILPLLKYCSEYKKAILNIYRSVQRDIFIYNLERIELYIAEQYVNKVTANLSMSDDDKKLLTRLYKCISVGIIIDWLEYGMDYDLVKAFERLGYLFSDSEKQALLKSSNCEKTSIGKI